MLVLVFLAAGWIGYDLVFRYVTAESSQSIAVVSAHEVFYQQLLMSLTFALMGMSTGFGAWLLGRLLTWRGYLGHLVLLIFVAILGSAGGIFLVAQRTRILASSDAATTGELNASISLSAIRLYEIGVIAAVCVVTVSVIFAMVYNTKRH